MTTQGLVSGFVLRVATGVSAGSLRVHFAYAAPEMPYPGGAMGWLFKRGGPPGKVEDRIRGIVTMPGSAGGYGESCVAVVFLRPWIDGKGATHPCGIRVLIPAPSATAGLDYALRWEGKAAAMTVTHAWPAGRNGLPGFETHALEPTTLDEAITEKQEPVVVEDRMLGEMRLDPAQGALVGTRRTALFDYEIIVDTPADARPAQARRFASAARRKVSKIERRLAALRQRAPTSYWRPTISGGTKAAA